MKFETQTSFFSTVAFAAVLIASGVMHPIKVHESLGMMTPCEAVLNEAVPLLAWTLNPDARNLIGLWILAVAICSGFGDGQLADSLKRKLLKGKPGTLRTKLSARE